MKIVWTVRILKIFWTSGPDVMSVRALIGCDQREGLERDERTCNLDGSLWQYGVWSFQTRDTKLERFLPKNQHSQILDRFLPC